MDPGFAAMKEIAHNVIAFDLFKTNESKLLTWGVR
jgi:hypothetical protein